MSETVQVVAAKWVNCSRCALVRVLVTLSYDGEVMCNECIADVARGEPISDDDDDA